MSKVSRDTLYASVEEVLKGSKDKPRNFTETIELQVRNFFTQKYMGS